MIKGIDTIQIYHIPCRNVEVSKKTLRKLANLDMLIFLLASPPYYGASPSNDGSNLLSSIYGEEGTYTAGTPRYPDTAL